MPCYRYFPTGENYFITLILCILDLFEWRTCHMCILNNTVNSHEGVSSNGWVIISFKGSYSKDKILSFWSTIAKPVEPQGDGMLRDSVGRLNGVSFGVRRDSRPFPSFSYLFTLAMVIMCKKRYACGWRIMRSTKKWLVREHEQRIIWCNEMVQHIVDT